jgi:catalase (peroxidase I)
MDEPDPSATAHEDRAFAQAAGRREEQAVEAMGGAHTKGKEQLAVAYEQAADLYGQVKAGAAAEAGDST